MTIQGYAGTVEEKTFWSDNMVEAGIKIIEVDAKEGYFNWIDGLKKTSPNLAKTLESGFERITTARHNYIKSKIPWEVFEQIFNEWISEALRAWDMVVV